MIETMEGFMAKKNENNLSRRERQIMDVIFEREQASAAEVLEGLHDPPSYSAVRALLSILEKKGHLKHRSEGARFIYSPAYSRNEAGRSALQRIMQTFYDGSVEKVVAALLDVSGPSLSDKELERLNRLIEKAGKENES